MNIYKMIAKDLREANADGMESHLAFVTLSISGIQYLKYIERLREKRKREAEESAARFQRAVE
jgi:hypothetical protein